MSTITYQGRRFACAPDETVLDCLTRQAEIVPHSCRSGVCQSCLMRAIDGMPPAAAQNGLKPMRREQGYFLGACLCRPDGDLNVGLPDDDVAPRTSAIVVAKKALNREILCLSLRLERPFAYRAGQFAHLLRADGLIRSYSLASVPNEIPNEIRNEIPNEISTQNLTANGVIEMHIRRLPNGNMSGWIHDRLQVGDTMEVAGPHGDCFYTPDMADRNLLLIGTGSGLAPLWGIVRDALRQGHRGPIHLYHGSRGPDGLYLMEELRQLSATHRQFAYTPCVSAEPLPGCCHGRADQTAFCVHSDLKGWLVYLCGHPDMVKTARKRAFLAGASIRDIFSDPFVASA